MNTYMLYKPYATIFQLPSFPHFNRLVATNLEQSGPKSDGNEGVHHIC